MHQRFTGSAPWEPIVGYARVVRAGPHLFVAGTTATNAEGRLVGPGEAYVQARQALHTIEAALRRAGASLDAVVRTRLYIVDRADWEAVGRAHGEVFGAIRPATTMVVVAGLIDPAMLVEIEAEAIVGDP